MSLWEKMKGLRNQVKKIRWIYEPYRNFKIGLISRKKNKDIREKSTFILREIERVISETSLMCFADYGTLLGAVRDHKLISWDLDMDYGLFIKNEDDWKVLETAMSNSGYKKIREISFRGCIAEQTYRFNNVPVDFFRHFQIDGHDVVYDFYMREDFHYNSENEMHVSEYHYAPVIGTRKGYVGNVEITIPENAEEYLECIYSSSWRTPDPEWSLDDYINRTKIEGEFGYVETFKGKF